MLAVSTFRTITSVLLLGGMVDATSVFERPHIRLNLVIEDKTCVDANSLHATFACADFLTRGTGWNLYGSSGKFPYRMSFSSFTNTEHIQEMKTNL